HLFASGAEIGWDLEAQGNGLTFYQSTLKSDYVADDANTYTATGVASTVFNGIGTVDFDSRSTLYDPNFCDTLQGISGSAICLRYTSAGTPGAALQYPNAANGTIVMLGFPFECIVSATTRNTAMSDALTFFSTPVTVVPVELSTFAAE